MTDSVAELPSDLAEALRQIVLQYAPIEIRSVESVKIHDEQFLSLVPEPAADESWAAGGAIEFFDAQDGRELFSAEITEFDPDSGAVWINKTKWDDFRDPGACRVRYQPYNFGKALADAYERLRLKQPALLVVPAANVFGGSQPAHRPTRFEIPDQVEVPSEGRRIWSRPWGVIWGPPGTGKTEAVARLVAEFAASNTPGRVLIVAPTNNAVDSVTLRLKKHLERLGGFARNGRCLVYRGGRGAGVQLCKEFPDCLEDKDYGEKYHELREKIAALVDERDEAGRRRNGRRTAELTAEIKALREQLPDETQFVVSEGRAKVVILTCFKALRFAGESDRGAIFSKLIIDEAGMVSRATAAAVATLGNSVLLAGDPKQIGPIFKSTLGLSQPVRAWVTQSPLGHLESAKGAAGDPNVWLLRDQHRMHPDIRSVVSKYTYDDVLADGPGPKAMGPSLLRGALPSRAVWVVLDEMVERIHEAYAKRSGHGNGYVRLASAELAVRRALESAEAGYSVLLLTPYRAQRRELRRLLPSTRAAKKISIGTIHGFQGAERDVVIVDTVNGLKSWPASDVHMIMNVAMSRAKHHFFLVAGRAELENPILSPLKQMLGLEIARTLGRKPDAAADLFAKLSAREADPSPDMSVPKASKNLGQEILEMRGRLPILTEEQVRLYQRRLGEGHRLVRGVAGSGKSFILAHWAVASVIDRPSHRVLITYFNRGMRSVVQDLLGQAAKRAHLPYDALMKQVTVIHERPLSCMTEPFDAVFVDEAQDIPSEQFARLFDLCKPTASGLRNLILFSDDSQNIYGRKTLEEIKEALPEGLKFTGRTDVLRESYRSTQSILNLAINLALDPKDHYRRGQSGLLEFMRVAELAEAGLLIRPEQASSGRFEVCYTDRIGVAPKRLSLAGSDSAFKRVAAEVRRLIADEGVSPGDVLVVSIKRPERAAAALMALKIPAVAYAGGAVDPESIPSGAAGHVRCTTVHTAKGHESPVVFFVLPEELEDIDKWMAPAKVGAIEAERIRRCILYVAASRAMSMLFLVGAESCRFMSAAGVYGGPDEHGLAAMS